MERIVVLWTPFLIESPTKQTKEDEPWNMSGRTPSNYSKITFGSSLSKVLFKKKVTDSASSFIKV